MTLQRSNGFVITLDVARDFGAPIVGVRFRDARAARTIMPVPETSVYEYYGAVFRKNKVGPAGQICHIQPVAKPFCVKRFSQGDFRAGAGAFDGAHDIRSLLRRKDVAALLLSAHAAFCAGAARGSSTFCASQETTGGATPSPISVSAAVARGGRA